MTATHNLPTFKRTLVAALIASLCVAATAAIAVILSGGHFDQTAARVIGTALALTVYSLVGLAAFHLAHRRTDLGWLAVLQFMLAAFGLIVAIAAIWSDSDNLWKPLGVTMVLSLGASHSALFLAAAKASEAPGSGFVRRATIAAGATLSCLLAIVIGAIGDDSTPVSPRLIGVVAVLFLLGNALLPLIRRLEKNGAR